MAANRDARGRRLFSEGFCSSIQDDGSDVYLTIDKTIQHIAEKEMQATVAATSAKGGVAIVMDPWSGNVLAMAVAPVFDPNRYSQFSPGLWRNRAIADVLEPGSTFKIFVVAASLEEKIINPEDTFFCENGKFRIGGRTISDVHPYGWLNVSDIIKHSSNIGVSKISKQIGTPLFFSISTNSVLPGRPAFSFRRKSRATCRCLISFPSIPAALFHSGTAFR